MLPSPVPMISAAKALAITLIRRAMTAPLPLLRQAGWRIRDCTDGAKRLGGTSRKAVRVVFIGTKRPPLKAIADRIGANISLRCNSLRPEVLRTAPRAVTEPPGIAVVPPTGRVVGRPIEDLEPDIRMFKPDADELHEIFRLD